jgi:hypothetical protein
MGRIILLRRLQRFVCLLCGSSVAVPKKHNVERHLQANNSFFEANYPFKSEKGKKKIKELKSKLSGQQSTFTRPVVKCKYTTVASLKIAHLLAKKKKLSIKMVSP